MSKYCPVLKKKVVYLECIDCEDKEKCKRKTILKQEKDPVKTGSEKEKNPPV